MAQLQSYHFDVGNSTSGPIGFCARVNARSRAHALELLRKALPTDLEIVKDDYAADGVGIQYIAVYVNEDYVKASDIDDFEEARAVHAA